MLAAGAAVVFDYHGADWPETIKEATGGRGVDAAANAANAGAATALRAVADGGRLATITSDPPEPERGTAVESLYVRPDATQLERATEALGAGQLAFTLGAIFPLAEAATALHHAIAGGGAVALAL